MDRHAQGCGAAQLLRPRVSGDFDFTDHLRRLCVDMVARLPQLSHIDLERILVTFGQARKRTSYGLYASLTPLRFRNGSLTEKRRGRLYTVQRVYDQRGREMLYILTFYLPRFMELGFRAKLITILHELWHVSPECNGDLRRHPGRCYAHTQSQQGYDTEMDRLVEQWLATTPSAVLYDFLHGSFADLIAQHRRIHGVKIRRPKLVPLP